MKLRNRNRNEKGDIMKNETTQEPMGDVWKFETGDQDIAAEELNIIIGAAIDRHSTSARNYLKRLWRGDSWNTIKTRAMTEGSIWYVWYMDGVNQHLCNMRAS